MHCIRRISHFAIVSQLQELADKEDVMKELCTKVAVDSSVIEVTNHLLQSGRVIDLTFGALPSKGDLAMSSRIQPKPAYTAYSSPVTWASERNALVRTWLPTVASRVIGVRPGPAGWTRRLQRWRMDGRMRDIGASSFRPPLRASLLSLLLAAALRPAKGDLDFKAFTRDPQGYASHIRLVDGSQIEYFSDEFNELCTQPIGGAPAISATSPFPGLEGIVQKKCCVSYTGLLVMI
eukprot:s4063_g5.t1